jgi:hypothetical protein
MEAHTIAVIIGDPRAGAWLIFFSYFAVAVLCARAFQVALIGSQLAADYPNPERRLKDRQAAYRASFRFWALVIALFVFLGVNKQIDLQTWLTRVGRQMATAQGWYDQRATVQMIFVLTIAFSGVVTLSVLLKLTRDLLPRHILAFVGLAILAVFLVVRAVSFHNLEAALRSEIVGMRLSWYLEMAGIACVGTCAVRNYWWLARKPDSRASLTSPGG